MRLLPVGSSSQLAATVVGSTPQLGSTYYAPVAAAAVRPSFHAPALSSTTLPSRNSTITQVTSLSRERNILASTAPLESTTRQFMNSQINVPAAFSSSSEFSSVLTSESSAYPRAYSAALKKNLPESPALPAPISYGSTTIVYSKAGGSKPQGMTDPEVSDLYANHNHSLHGLAEHPNNTGILGSPAPPSPRNNMPLTVVESQTVHCQSSDPLITDSSQQGQSKSVIALSGIRPLRNGMLSEL